MEQEHQFIDYIEQSIIKNWDKDSLTDYKGITRSEEHTSELQSHA